MTSISPRTFGIISLLGAMFFANTTNIFTKMLLGQGWTPVSIYFVTLLIMTIIIGVHELIAIERGVRWGMTKEDIKGLLLTTLTGGIIAPIIFFYGLEQVLASEASILSSGLPLFIVIMAVFFLKEHFTEQMVLGGVLITAALAVLLWDDLQQFSFQSGAAIIIMWCVIAAFTTIFHKKYVKHRHLDSIVLVRSIISLIAVGVWMYITEPESFGTLSEPQNIWLILGQPILGFIAPFFLYFYALNELKASEVGIIGATQPIFGVVLASVFLGEDITTQHLVSLILVVCGIIFINVPLTKKRIVPTRVPVMGPLRK